MDRRRRLERITRILEGDTVADQESLRRRLARSGLRVSQASLSRDLRELGAQRFRGPGGDYFYSLSSQPPAVSSRRNVRRRFAESVMGVRRCQFIVLVFTPPGEAPRMSEVLDHAGLPDLAGTVAGDDTVLCMTEDPQHAKRLERQFKEMIE